MKKVKLIQITQTGEPSEPLGPLPHAVRRNCEATAAFHANIGFVPPWVGYISVCNGSVVGNGGFKGPPCDGKVEISYFTLPELEGQGYGTATAWRLTNLARQADPNVLVTAQTLPLKNASNTLLQRIGFKFTGVVLHPEDGEVWEWHFRPGEQRDA